MSTTNQHDDGATPTEPTTNNAATMPAAAASAASTQPTDPGKSLSDRASNTVSFTVTINNGVASAPGAAAASAPAPVAATMPTSVAMAATMPTAVAMAVEDKTSDDGDRKLPALEGDDDFDSEVAVSSYPFLNIFVDLLCPNHLCHCCSKSIQASPKRKRPPLTRTRSGGKKISIMFSSDTSSAALQDVQGSVKYIKIDEDGNQSRPIWVDIPKTRGECVKMLCTQAEQITTLNGEKKQSTRDHYCTDRFAKHLISEALSGKIFPNAKALGQAAYNRFRNEEFNKSDIWSISDFIMETIGEEVEVFEDEFLKTLKDGSS